MGKLLVAPRADWRPAYEEFRRTAAPRPLGVTRKGKLIREVSGASTVWRYPLQPRFVGPGTAVTAAALTSGLGGQGVPQLPPVSDPGGRIIVDAAIELTSTSATPTITLGTYIGSVQQAIGSKLLLAATTALAISASETGWVIFYHWEGKIQVVSPTVGKIYGNGWSVNPTAIATWGDQVWFPATQAARTVSTVNLTQTNEIDLGITLSSVTGTPSAVVTAYDVDFSG